MPWLRMPASTGSQRLPVAAHGRSDRCAVDLVGRGEDQPRPVAGAAYRIEQIQGALGVDREVIFRIVQAGGDCHLGGQMEDAAGPLHHVAHEIFVADVSDLRP
jgi:hypothetical protein